MSTYRDRIGVGTFYEPSLLVNKVLNTADDIRNAGYMVYRPSNKGSAPTPILLRQQAAPVQAQPVRQPVQTQPVVQQPAQPVVQQPVVQQALAPTAPTTAPVQQVGEYARQAQPTVQSRATGTGGNYYMPLQTTDDPAQAALDYANRAAAIRATGQIPVHSVAMQGVLDRMAAQDNLAHLAATNTAKQVAMQHITSDPEYMNNVNAYIQSGMSSDLAAKAAVQKAALERGNYGVANNYYTSTFAPAAVAEQERNVMVGMNTGANVAPMVDPMGNMVSGRGMDFIYHNPNGTINTGWNGAEYNLEPAAALGINRMAMSQSPTSQAFSDSAAVANYKITNNANRIKAANDYMTQVAKRGQEQIKNAIALRKLEPKDTGINPTRQVSALLNIAKSMEATDPEQAAAIREQALQYLQPKQ